MIKKTPPPPPLRPDVDLGDEYGVPTWVAIGAPALVVVGGVVAIGILLWG